jgi:hypothetical protein
MDTANKKKLKPCPFCGSDVSMFWDGAHSKYETIECFSCEIAPSIWGDPAVIAEKWNNRPGDQEPRP